MLRALLNRLGGKSSSRKMAARPKPARRTVLTLEALEKRELLSANVPGFSLNNGNLYNTSGAQARLIDTGVKSFSAANNQVVDLHTDSTLYVINTDGTGVVTLDTGVQGFAIAGNGMVVDLETNGTLCEQTVAGQREWVTLDTGVQSFAIAGCGMVVDLETSGSLCEQITPDQREWVTLDTGVQSFAIGDNGDVYYLQAGSSDVYDVTQEAAGLPGFVHGGVQHMAQGPNGQIWLDLGADGLRLFDPAASSYPGYGTVQGAGFAVGDNGDVYYLQAGSSDVYDVTQEAAGLPGFVHGGVQHMAQGPNGQIWLDLGADGLRLFDPAASSYPGYGTVQGAGFAVGDNGDVYYLQAGSSDVYDVTQEAAGLPGFVHGGVLSMAQGPAGRMFVNLQDGLRLYDPLTSSYAGYGVVQGYALGGDGNGYYLQNGVLYQMRLNSATDAVVSPGVASFAVGGDGRVYFLTDANNPTGAGNLYIAGLPAGQNLLSAGVASFGVGGDGLVYFLTNAANPTGAGNLFQNTPTSNNLVSPGVASFGVGGDGRVYFLTNAANPTGAGNLYIAGLPAGQNLVSAGVASFGVGGDGRVYFLTDASCPAGPGNLYIAGLPAGQNLVGSDVASFAIRGDGNLYLLHTNFDLTLNSPNGNQLQDFGAVQGFALGSDGNAYYLLPNGDLCHDAHPSEVLHDIRAFAVGADGSLDVLTRGGYLSRNGVLVGHTHLVIFPLYSVNAFVAAIVLDPAIEATPIQYKEAGAFTGLGTAYEPSAFPATTATTPASYWASPQGMAESMQSVLQAVLNWASQSASLIVGLSVGVISGEFGNSIQATANALVDSVLSDQAIKGIVANVVPANEAEQAEEGVALVVAAATLSTGNLASTFVSLLFSPTVIDGLGDVVLDISLPIYNQVYNTSLSYQPVGGAGGSGGSGGSVSGSGNGGAGGGAGLWGGVSSGQSDSGDGSNSLTGSF